MSVLHAKAAELIVIPFGMWTWVGPSNHVFDGSRSVHVKGQFCGWKWAHPGDAQTCPVVCILKATQLREPVHCRCRLGVLGWSHWCHLANTIELSVCCGDVALCQITLTICLFCYVLFYVVFIGVWQWARIALQYTAVFVSDGSLPRRYHWRNTLLTHELCTEVVD